MPRTLEAGRQGLVAVLPGIAEAFLGVGRRCRITLSAVTLHRAEKRTPVVWMPFQVFVIDPLRQNKLTSVHEGCTLQLPHREAPERRLQVRQFVLEANRFCQPVQPVFSLPHKPATSAARTARATR